MTRATSNFASRGARPVGRVAALVWTSFALVCAVLALGLAGRGGAEDEMAQIDAHRDRLREQIAALTELAAEAPTAEAIADQAETAAYYNSLTGSRRAPLGEVMALIASRLVEDVRISQLSYDVETGRLTFSLQSGGEVALPDVLHKLETAAELGSVILERQVRLQQGERAVVQYDIVAEAK